MPNHITNILTVGTPDGDSARAILDAMAVGKSEFTFNAVIPMPDRLDIVCGTYSDLLERPHLFGVEEVRKRLLDGSDKDVENFFQAIRNLREYGHVGWYSWSIENWGTKWDAYSVKREEGNRVRFDTAWNSPVKIFLAMSRKWPESVFQVDYADEDIGSNCGTRTFCRGEMVADVTPDDPVRFALQVIGWDYDQYMSEMEED